MEQAREQWQASRLRQARLLGTDSPSGRQLCSPLRSSSPPRRRYQTDGPLSPISFQCSCEEDNEVNEVTTEGKQVEDLVLLQDVVGKVPEIVPLSLPCASVKGESSNNTATAADSSAEVDVRQAETELQENKAAVCEAVAEPKALEPEHEAQEAGSLSDLQSKKLLDDLEDLSQVLQPLLDELDDIGRPLPVLDETNQHRSVACPAGKDIASNTFLEEPEEIGERAEEIGERAEEIGERAEEIGHQESGERPEEEVSEEICRICRGGEEEGPLFFPCQCSGSIKYVHQECLQKWLQHRGRRALIITPNPEASQSVSLEILP